MQGFEAFWHFWGWKWCSTTLHTLMCSLGKFLPIEIKELYALLRNFMKFIFWASVSSSCARNQTQSRPSLSKAIDLHCTSKVFSQAFSSLSTNQEHAQPKVCSVPNRTWHIKWNVLFNPQHSEPQHSTWSTETQDKDVPTCNTYCVHLCRRLFSCSSQWANLEDISGQNSLPKAPKSHYKTMSHLLPHCKTRYKRNFICSVFPKYWT